MNLFPLLYSLLISLIPAGSDDIREAWSTRPTAVPTLNVTWSLTRDSREERFGLEPLPPGQPVSRLRLDQEQRRVDTQRLTAHLRDGRTRPVESDPDRARVEFRNVLLEEQLAGPQSVPQWNDVSLIIQPNGQQAGPTLGPLEMMLANAPVWAVRPEWLTSWDNLVVMTGQHSLLGQPVRVLKETGVPDRSAEIWVENQAPFRVLRVILHRSFQTPVQLDIEYTDDHPLIPATWTTQLVGPTGETHTFASARRESVTIGQPLEPDTFELTAINPDLSPPLDPKAIARRQWLRSVMDSNVTAVAIVLFGLVWTVLALRRKFFAPKVNQPPVQISPAEWQAPR